MTFVYIIAGLFLATVAYIAISQSIKFNKAKKRSNLIYDIQEINYLDNALKNAILKGINTERLIHGSMYVVADKITTALADKRCETMEEENNISHAGVGVTFTTMNTYGADGSAEILAYGFNSYQGVINGWLNSDSHREAMLSPKWEWCGVGIKFNENNRMIVCVLFGKDDDN